MDRVDKIKAKLEIYAPNIKPSGHDAAVALILREQSNQIELLLIERAISLGDPWSGQLAFPGGRVRTEDRNLFATAIRETLEETGIILNDTMFIGRLDDEFGSIVPVHVACFVFFIRTMQEIKLNNEIKNFFWWSLDQISNPNLQRIHMTESGPMPAISVVASEYPLLWGLTYRFIEHFTNLFNSPLSETH